MGMRSRLRSPREARKRYGIKMMPQDVELCGQLITGRNIMLGLEGALVDRNRLSRRERAMTTEVLRLIGAHVDPQGRAEDLSTPEARFIQIAHALLPPVSVVLCDEPTRGALRSGRRGASGHLDQDPERSRYGHCICQATGSVRSSR